MAKYRTYLERINAQRDRRQVQYDAVLARLQTQYPDEDMAQLAEWASDEMYDMEIEEQCERAERGEPEDTPCLENGRDNCDDWGTGEGRYHGRI
jgi:predicted lipid-binding transport protein (Tim44 family)